MMQPKFDENFTTETFRYQDERCTIKRLFDQQGNLETILVSGMPFTRVFIFDSEEQLTVWRNKLR